MEWIALCLLFASSMLLSGAAAKNDTIYFIEDELSTYSFSCPPAHLVGLSADHKSLLFYDIKKQQLIMSKDLPLPGQLIQSSNDGSLHVVTHDSYVTIVKDYKLKTYSVPIIESSSIVIVRELVCITPDSHSEETAAFMCLNVNNASDDWHGCGNYEDVDGQAYINEAKGWVYIYTSREMRRFKLLSDHECLESIDSGGENNYDSSEPLGFSYDGSRVFLYNGMTLTADFSKPRGDFNASNNLYYYNYFSQSSLLPHNVAGIRTDVNDTVYLYGWPYLMPVANTAKSIPIPSQASAFGAKEVHVCDDLIAGVNTTYVVANYMLANGATKTAVVTLKY